MFRGSAVFLTFMLCFNGPSLADDAKPLTNDQFAKLHKLIKRQRGEWAWSEIDWSINFAEAQRRSISEGKPIFVALAAQGSVAGCV